MCIRDRGNSVTLIEWGNQIISALPKDHLEVFIEHCDHDDERMITLIPSGEVWNDRMVNLQHSLTDWTFQEC